MTTTGRTTAIIDRSLELTGSAALVPDPARPDGPAHQWRGFMLDCARTFWSVAEICEVLDLMARYRLNRFHWHLTDDSGWRLPVPGYERLTQVGAYLPRPSFSNYNNVDAAKRESVIERARGMKTGGYYSANDIRTVVAHAARLGIQVLPEVDLPGHMAAAIHCYPELGKPHLRDRPPTTWQERNDLLWPTPAAFDLITASLESVVELFPSPAIHIGGDECHFPSWDSDDHLVARHGRTDGAGHGHPVQALFIAHARRVLAAHGRRLVGWDEMSRLELAGDETLIAWRSGDNLRTVLASGLPWVYAEAKYLYLNRLAGPAESEPAGMFGMITPRSIIEMPIPRSDQLRGVQAALWTEFILDRQAMHYQLFPRLLAFAERAWMGEDVSWSSFAPRLAQEAAWLSAHDIHGRPLSGGEPQVEPGDHRSSGCRSTRQ